MNTREIARVISRMPFFQVHYTQKKIVKMLKEGKIPSAVIEEARAKISK